MLLASGVNAKIASERLGHSTIVLTLDTYSHVLPDMQQSAAESIEKTLFKTGTYGLAHKRHTRHGNGQLVITHSLPVTVRF
jgi:hypothetical protein